MLGKGRFQHWTVPQPEGGSPANTQLGFLVTWNWPCFQEWFNINYRQNKTNKCIGILKIMLHLPTFLFPPLFFFFFPNRIGYSCLFFTQSTVRPPQKPRVALDAPAPAAPQCCADTHCWASTVQLLFHPMCLKICVQFLRLIFLFRLKSHQVCVKKRGSGGWRTLCSSWGEQLIRRHSCSSH